MFYGWIVVGVAFFTIMISMGIWYSFSVYYVEILNEFGWSRAATAGVFLVYGIVHGIASPVVGYAVRRWGSRAVITVGNLVMVAGLVLSSRTSEVWHLFVFYGCIVAAGGAAQGYPPNTAIVANWFLRKRGLAMGIAFAGNGAGVFLLPKLSQHLIDAFGWRTAYLSLTLLLLGVVLPLNLFLSRFRPEEKGLTVDGLPAAEERNAVDRQDDETAPQGLSQAPAKVTERAATTAPVWTMKTAFRSPTFWLINGAYGLTAFGLLLIVIHQFAFFIDLGLSRGFAAGLISATGIALILGQLMGGTICDRHGSEVAYTVCGVCIVVAMGLLLLVSQAGSTWALYPAVFFLGLGGGGAGMIIAVASADIFHGPDYAAIAGYHSLGWGIGAGMGPILAGWIYDVTFSYQYAFLLAMLISIVATGMMWIAAPRAYRRVRV